MKVLASILCKARDERAGGIAQNLSLLLSANCVSKNVFDVLNRFAITQSHRQTERNEQEHENYVFEKSKAGLKEFPCSISFDNVDGVEHHTDRMGVHDRDFHYTHIVARQLCQHKEELDHTKPWRSRSQLALDKYKFLLSTHGDLQEVGLYSVEFVFKQLISKFRILCHLQKEGASFAAGRRAAEADNTTNFPDWMVDTEVNTYPRRSVLYPIPLCDQAEASTTGMIAILKHINEFAKFTDSGIDEEFVGPLTWKQQFDPQIHHIPTEGDQMSCSQLRSAQKVI